jgi:shikimate dehydrogenase
MSPAMHNAAFRQAGLNYVYTAFKVTADGLSKAIDGMRGFGIPGLNVTIPHKVAVMAMLDRIDPLAESIGAVNTIVNDGERLTGYNTDASGFLRALSACAGDPRGRRVLVLGAGGASRAICHALADAGAVLSILNRREELDWAQQLADRISARFGTDVRADELTRQNAAAALQNAGILVNATSVGMSPDSERSPIDADLLRGDMVVFDAVYNPLDTRLLRDAKAAGAVTVSGIDMLAWQGALAFRLWTGEEAPADLMRDEAVRLLQKPAG